MHEKVHLKFSWLKSMKYLQQMYIDEPGATPKHNQVENKSSMQAAQRFCHDGEHLLWCTWDPSFSLQGLRHCCYHAHPDSPQHILVTTLNDTMSTGWDSLP